MTKQAYLKCGKVMHKRRRRRVARQQAAREERNGEKDEFLVEIKVVLFKRFLWQLIVGKSEEVRKMLWQGLYDCACTQAIILDKHCG